MNPRWRRRLRRWHLWLRNPKFHVVSAPAYSHRWPVSAIDGRRAARILSWIDELGLVSARNLHLARPAPVRQLSRIHDADYLHELQEPGSTLKILGTRLSDEDQDRFLLSQRTMVGGTVLASRLALRHRAPIFNLAGGLHHAEADRGQGFCAFHDIAVAISLLRRDLWQEPILIVDLDLHDGEGTRSIFATDRSVHTLSIHNRDLGSADAVESTSVALGDAVGDALYLNTVRRTVEPLLDRFRPAMVFYLAGADPAATDELGNWNVSAEALLRRDCELLSWTAGRKISTVVLPAGGYGRSAWRIPAQTLARLALGDGAPLPPEALDLDLRRFRRIASVLHVADLTVDPGSGWELTEADLSPGAPSRARFLGYYSAHGIEVAMERYGVLAALAERGYPEVRVALDFSARDGDSVRLFPADGPDIPLFELTVRRDSRSIPGFELLYVEWLLMQDPSREFSAERPALPGQNHPGLGMLARLVAMLVIACERVGLDGLAFTPRNYHIAAQTSDRFHFLDPAAEARFRALRRLLGTLPLGDAAQALEQGRVVERDGTEVRWEPTTMLLPVSSALARHFADPDRGERVATHAQDLCLRNPG